MNQAGTSIRSRAIHAFSWNAVDAVLRQLVQFGITIALARLLLPKDFGIFAILLLFVGIAHAFVNGGLPWALVNKKDVTEADKSTAFWANMAIACVMAGLIALCGPYAAEFYDEPVLESLCYVIGIAVIMSAVTGIQQALLTKELQFRLVIIANTTGVVFAGALAIFMAWAGYGVWSLAGQAIAHAFIVAAILWFNSGWKPRFLFSVASARVLFGFGGYMLLSSLVEIGYTRFYALLVGRLYGLRTVGFYNRAETVSMLPTGLITHIVGRVTYPLFSKMQDDKQRIGAVLLKLQRVIMILHAPVMFGIAVVSAPVIGILFGDKWIEAAPFLSVLAIAFLFAPMLIMNNHALLALGRSDLFFRLVLVLRLSGIAVIAAMSFRGEIAVAWGVVIANYAAYLVVGWFVARKLGFAAREHVRSMFIPVAISLIMFVTLWWVDNQLLNAGYYERLAILVGLGVGIYSGLTAIIMRKSLPALYVFAKEQIANRADNKDARPMASDTAGETEL